MQRINVKIILLAAIQIDAHEVNLQLVCRCFNRGFLSGIISQLVQGITLPFARGDIWSRLQHICGPGGSLSVERNWLGVQEPRCQLPETPGSS